MSPPTTPAAIELTAAAVKDLDDVLIWLAARNPSAAEALRESIDSVLTTLATGMLHGPASTLASGARCRRFYVHPLWIYYQHIPGVLRVLRIYHHARTPLE